MIPDRDLLRQYAERGDETAFAEVVQRQVDLVYSAARRQVGGDAHLAEDVTQAVFVELARQAWRLCQRESITGWLFTTARYTANNLRRREYHRVAREQEAYAMQQPAQSPEPQWDALQPVLDEAVCALNHSDREAVLLRFFQNKSHREVGAALGLNEEAARKRVDRALDKLRSHFARQGVTVSAALLATAITANSVQAAPASLAAALSGGAVASASQASFSTTILKAIYMTTKTKSAIVVAVAVAIVAAIPLALQQRELADLRAELAAHDASAAQAGSGKEVAMVVSPLDAVARINQILKSNKTRTDMARDLLDLFATLKNADFGAILDAYAKQPRNILTDLARSLLLAQWAKSNPAAALAWVKAHSTDAQREDDLTSVFQSWEAEDSTAAFAALKQITDPAMRDDVQNTLIAWMSLHAPKDALALLRQLPLGRQTVESYAVIFGAWGDQDPVAASAAAAALPPSQARLAALAGVAATWAHSDPQAALAWANSLPAGITRTAVLGSALTMLAKDNPSVAASALGQLPKGDLQNQLIGQIASSWAATDPASALAWVNSVAQGQNQDKAVEGIIAQVSQTDPAAAASLLDKIPQASVRDVALPQLATAWAQQDVQGALAWVQSLPTSEGNARSDAFKNVMSSWTNTDPVSAASYIQQNLTNDPNFSQLSIQVASSWAHADPNAAFDWAQTLPAGNAQNMAERTALTVMAQQDPQAAWDNAQQMDAGSNRNQTSARIIAAWSTQDPAQAASLIDTLPDTAIPARTLAVAGVVQSWVQQDPQAASQWLNTQPAGQPRDAGVMTLIQAEGVNDLPTAYNWARSMDNSGLRGQTVNTVVTQWAQTDPAAATAAVMADYGPDAPSPNASRQSQLLDVIKKNAPANYTPPAQ